MSSGGFRRRECELAIEIKGCIKGRVAKVIGGCVKCSLDTWTTFVCINCILLCGYRALLELFTVRSFFCPVDKFHTGMFCFEQRTFLLERVAGNQIQARFFTKNNVLLCKRSIEFLSFKLQLHGGVL